MICLDSAGQKSRSQQAVDVKLSNLVNTKSRELLSSLDETYKE